VNVIKKYQNYTFSAKFAGYCQQFTALTSCNALLLHLVNNTLFLFQQTFFFHFRLNVTKKQTKIVASLLFRVNPRHFTNDNSKTPISKKTIPKWQFLNWQLINWLLKKRHF